MRKKHVHKFEGVGGYRIKVGREKERGAVLLQCVVGLCMVEKLVWE